MRAFWLARKSVWQIPIWLVGLTGEMCLGQLASSVPEVKTVLTAPPPQPASLQVERVPVAGGAELLVLMKGARPHLRADEQGGPVPLVAVLRDTLGDNDPSNDRLRYVWSLTSTRPTFWQRAASALPFFYWRLNGPRKVVRDPSPVLDLAEAHRPVVTTLTEIAGQNLLLDSQGVFIRSSSRALRGNAGDYRQAHVMRALTAMVESENEPSVRAAFSTAEMQQVQARLLLARQPLGGLVSDSRLSEVYERRRLETESDRGHNWELLRQRAEAENLLFEPLFDNDGDARFGLISVSRADIGSVHSFQHRFLNFSNPWTDARLRHWKGYVLHAGAVESPVAGAGERIPLGLYSLDHPHVPLLMVDFRDARAPRRKELMQRTVADVTTSVLRLSYLSNWYYYLGRAAFDFVSGRHGGARDRAARARAYEELRLFLLLDDQWDPGFKDEVRKRLLKNSLNPLDSGTRTEIEIAQNQYARLARAAADPNKLAARLIKDRRAEMVPLVHGPKAQRAFRVANIVSFGLYTHRELPTPELWAQLDVQRRLIMHRQYLEQVLAASPGLDVAANLQLVGESVVALAAAHRDPVVPGLLASVYRRTNDQNLRAECLQSLRQLPMHVAQDQLSRLLTAQNSPQPVSIAPATPVRLPLASPEAVSAP